MTHSLIESYASHISEIQDSLNDYRKRQEKLLEKAKKRDFDQRLLNALFELPEKYRERIVIQKVKEGVHRGPFEEFYPTLREYGAEPEALKTFWSELGDIPVDDDGIIQESFLWWPKGTDREDIWQWFDEKYFGGVAKLMGLANYTRNKSSQK